MATQQAARTRAFTLVELLVAIGIVVLLVALTLGVGSSVANAGRKRSTEAALQVLDQTLDRYIEVTGGLPPALVQVPANRLAGGGPLQGQDLYYPLVDGVGQAGASGTREPINSVGLYLLAAEPVSGIQNIIAGLDQRYVRAYRPVINNRGQAQSAQAQPELLTVFDAWDNPIRMVHPRFDGTVLGGGDFGAVNVIRVGDQSDGFFAPGELPLQANRFVAIRQIRRLAPTRADWLTYSETEIANNFVNGVGDADGGICPAPRPYFYSAGPDGDPATIEDNIYTTRPRFPAQN